MKKAPDAFRTISEVSDWLDTPAHVLRFWESRFAQVKPVKRAGGRRYYRPDDMRLLGGIKQLLHSDGLTIKGVQKILREKGIKHVAELSPAVTDAEVEHPKDSRPSAKPAIDMDSLTAEIADKVAITARGQEAPPKPEPPKSEPLILAKMRKPAAGTANAGKTEGEPETAFGSAAETPQFLRREANTGLTPSPSETIPAKATAAEASTGTENERKISDLYGRLLSLRQRMQDA